MESDWTLQRNRDATKFLQCTKMPRGPCPRGNSDLGENRGYSADFQ